MKARIVVTLMIVVLAFAAVAKDMAVCAVCGPREGSGFEPVEARATYKGKEYAFCSLKCKVEFLKDPQAFLVTDEGKPAPAFTLKTFDGRAVSLADYRGKRSEERRVGEESKRGRARRQCKQRTKEKRR